MENEYRLTPAMASRKLQVASFWHQYKARWGRGPSYGEISGAMGISYSTARDAVRRATRDGLIDRLPGARRGEGTAKPVPTRLSPDLAELVIAQLRAQGVVMLSGPVGPDGRTYCPLPLVPELDHIPSGDDGDEHARADTRRDGGDAGDRDPGAQEGDRRAA